MPTTRHRLQAAFIIALTAAPASASDHPTTADAVIAASKRAMGGSAWDRMNGTYEEGTRSSTPYRTWVDFTRYGVKIESGSGRDVQSQGYDGETVWQHSAAGTRTSRDADAIAEVRTTAWLSGNGFFFPKRFPAKTKWLGAQTVGDRRFDVIEATPQGGKPLELWFDHNTHFLTRVVDNTGPSPITVSASDFRRVGKVMIAFHLSVSGGDGTPLDEGQLASIVLRRIPRQEFAPPQAGK